MPLEKIHPRIDRIFSLSLVSKVFQISPRMRRAGQLPAVAKRRISIAVSAHAAEPSLASSVETNTPDLEKKDRTVKISQFLDMVYQPYPVLQRRYAPTSRAVSLSPNQIDLGNEIRSSLELKDVKSLCNAIRQMSHQRDWTPITQGLTRTEMSLLLKNLIDGQLKELDQLKKFNNVLDRSALKSAKKSINRASSSISSLFTQMKLIEGLTFTSSDAEHLLRFETLNYSYPSASRLIAFIEQKKLCNSVLYHNLKFKILAETDPTTWKVLRNRTLTPSSYRGSLKNTVAFSHLLLNFTEASSSNFAPNLESHRQIICGFGKAGDLQQVRQHIQQIWGISPDDSQPEALLPITSSLYPDVELLVSIVDVFGYNNATSEALFYVVKFAEHYDLDVRSNTHIWRVLTKMMEVEHHDDATVLADKFNGMWDYMQSLGVQPSVGLYNKRFEILSKAQRVQELSGDLTSLWKVAVASDDIAGKHRTRKVLTKYLRSIAFAVYTSLPEQEAQKVVKKYMKRYAVDARHLEELLAMRTALASSVVKKQESFDALQRQYDEEDDEDSLW